MSEDTPESVRAVIATLLGEHNYHLSAAISALHHYAELIVQHNALKALVDMGVEVVEDFMPNIGVCALQDYRRLNEFLTKAKEISDERKNNDATPNVVPPAYV